MTSPAEAIPYCPDCDRVPCECDTYDANPRFLRDHVDPESLNGFNPPHWVGLLLNDGPIRVDPASDAFWEYDDGCWREARKVVARRLPTKMGRTFRHGNIAHVGAYLYAKMVGAGKVIHPDRPDTRFVSVPSGLFEVDTGEIRDHDPDVLTTYRLQVDPVFDSPTPEFDRFLESVIHPGDRGRVLDILAYLLLPGNPLQKAVMFSGRGRNGKGVLLRVIESIIGKHHAATVSLQEMGTRFAAADLYGKVINVVGDIDGEHITHTGKFKQMTGDDTVRMDVKHAQAFSAKVWAVPVFSANQIPTSADTSHGYLRRWEVVEFPNTFDGSDTTLVDRLLAELPAITGKLLSHAASNGYRIRESGPGKKAHDVFASRSDPVRTWLAETDLGGFVSRKDAYEDYKLWIDDGNGKTALTKGNFFARVSAVLGVEPHKSDGAWGWRLPEGAQKCPKSEQNALSPDKNALPNALSSEDVSAGRYGFGSVVRAERELSTNLGRGMDAPRPERSEGVPTELDEGGVSPPSPTELDEGGHTYLRDGVHDPFCSCHLSA